MSVCLKNTQMSMENACPLEEKKNKNKNAKNIPVKKLGKL